MAKSVGPRVCVIGAGIAGLTSARYLKDERINFTVFEATSYIGGTWRYDPRIGKDENGLPLHTSMYKNLRTNLPKPTMELRGFPTPKEMPSFPSWNEYYHYIKSYAAHFDLEKHIKFLQMVTSVTRKGKLWIVKHKHVLNGDEYENEYDFIIVGTGHFSKPNTPKVRGEEIFKGTIIHSHDYRIPEVYQDRRVLVVGAGPSGMDITMDVACVCKKLVHSHHSRVDFRTKFPKHYIKMPDIREYNETGVFFVDGTYEEIDDVIYCTGYQYHYPFLDETSGLTMDTHSVIPLYRYMVNINQPSMVFMGLVIRACIVIAIDAQNDGFKPNVATNLCCEGQFHGHRILSLAHKTRDTIKLVDTTMGPSEARYATAMIKCNFTLPSQEAMMAEWEKQAEIILARGRPISDIHFLAEKEDQYYEEISKESGIERVPPVMFKIRSEDTEAKKENLYTYRNYVYEIIDKDTFVRTLDNETTCPRCKCGAH